MWRSNFAARFSEAQPPWSRWALRYVALPAWVVACISIFASGEEGAPWWGFVAFAAFFVVGAVQWFFYLNRPQR
jgi:hypothetical protein